jgi:thermostable 8-oxoguanine DNA glycosylase
MINPFNVTNFNYSEAELQEFLVACIAVAGKTAKTMFPKTHQLLWESTYTLETPFKTLINMGDNLGNELRRVGMGKYNILENALHYIPRDNSLNLKSCTPEDLEKFKGIGMKTSRFFIVHSRPTTDLAILDRHILRFLREKGYANIPDNTPTQKDYIRIEKYFLDEAKKIGKSVADLDLDIWKSFARQ